MDDFGGSTLPPNAVHVWIASVAAHAAQESVLLRLLDADEQAKARRFYFAADRAQYIIAHGLLRTVLGQYLELPPTVLRFDAGQYGKPILRDPPQPLQFNMSHSGDLIAIAIAYDRPVGIDVERWVDVEYDDLSETFFSDLERSELRSLTAEQKAAGFFACWTRKEAYIKATGFGVSQGLDYFDVSLTPGAPARLVDDRLSGRPSEWSMHELVIHAGYSGALAVRGDDVAISQRVVAPAAAYLA